MFRPNFSLWSDLVNAMLIICILAQNVEMQMAKLHMGILKSDLQYVIVDEMEQQFQSEESLPYKDYEYFQRLQCSYALCAYRHLLLSEEFLYNSDNEFIYSSDYGHILFDTEAASMLATVLSMPFRSPLSEDIQWSLWFYTNKVHSLLSLPFKGEKMLKTLKTQTMFKVHQSIVESLRLFVIHNMGKFKDAQKILKQIDIENMFEGRDLMETISENKKLLKEQIKFNEMYGVSTDGIKHISLRSIASLVKLDEIERIVVEYFGKTYWFNALDALNKMYGAATIVNNTISCRVTYLWHTKNVIMKILKLILITFIEKYLVLTSKMENVEEIKAMDKAMTSKLMEFYQCVGDGDFLIRKFNNRYLFPDFYDVVKTEINSEKTFYPDFNNCPETLTKNFSYFYNSLVIDESSEKTSTETQEWTDMDDFLKKVEDLFSDVNMVIAKSFYSYPFYAKSFKNLKEIEHPSVV